MNSIRTTSARLPSVLSQSTQLRPRTRGLATMAKYALQDTVPLPPTNTPIPRLGLGVYKAKGSKCAAAVSAALEHGYRHVDTAQVSILL